MAKTFVEFYFPGTNVAGYNEREVSSRTIEAVGVIPQHAISYRFFDKKDDTKNEEENKINFSPYHWIATKEYSSQEFKLKYGHLKDDSDLFSANRVVKAVTGGFYPLKDEDIVVFI